MMPVDQYRKLTALLSGCALAAALLACDDNPTAVVRSAPAPRASTLNMTDAQRLSDGANKLLAAMNKPTVAFHFAFKGNVNLAKDKTQPPKVGPVALVADISPEEIDLTETRGLTTKTSKARRNDDINWDMANLATLGVMTNPTLVIAVAATVADPPSVDLVGGTLADKFTFDTSTSTPSQQRSLELARAVVTTVKGCRGTAWIAKDSGLLVKFHIDADYLDSNHHAWTEHYDGDVTPN